MSLRFPRGSTLANDEYTGPDGSLSVDRETPSLRVHDGVTPGGFKLQPATGEGGSVSISGTAPITVSEEEGSQVISVAEVSTTSPGVMSASDKNKLDGIEEGAEVNLLLATKEAAEEGEDNETVLTPLRLFEALSAGNFTIDFGEL